MRQASSTGLPEAFTCPATLDRPVRRDFQKPSLVLSQWTGQDDWVPKPSHLSCRAGQARTTGLCVQIARSLHSSNRFRLARSTELFETLSLESLTRFGTLSLESLTPLTPFFGSLGIDYHRQCHRPTFPTHNLKENTTGNQNKPQCLPEVQWSCSAVAVVLVCLVAVASLPCNEGFPHC